MLPAQQPVAGDGQRDGDRHDHRRRQGQERVGRHEDNDGDGGVDEPHRSVHVVEQRRLRLGDGRRNDRLLAGRAAVPVGRVHVSSWGGVVVCAQQRPCRCGTLKPLWHGPRGPAAGVVQARVVDEQRDLHAVGEVELGEDRRYVGLHRGQSDVVGGGDLGVGGTRADGERDGALAVGEQAEPVAGGGAARVLPAGDGAARRVRGLAGATESARAVAHRRRRRAAGADRLGQWRPGHPPTRAGSPRSKAPCSR